MTGMNKTKGLQVSVWPMPGLENAVAFHPWEVQHQPDHSEIEVYVEATGQWEIIAEIAGEDHVAIADTIVALANSKNHMAANNLFHGVPYVHH